MLVVSDTSPLSYSVLIGVDHILPKLFGEIVIPAAVLGELKHPGAPQQIQAWIRSIPDWLIVRGNPEHIRREFASLDPGEAAALELASVLKANLVLIDERLGTLAARSAGLQTTGLVGVLERAHKEKLISLGDALRNLRAVGCHLSPAFLEVVAKRNGITLD